MQNFANLMACFVTASSASTESPLAPAPPMSLCDLQLYTGTPPAKATTPKCRLPQVYPFSRSVCRSRLVAHTPQRVAGPALSPNLDISPLSASIGKKGHALGLQEPTE